MGGLSQLCISAVHKSEELGDDMMLGLQVNLELKGTPGTVLMESESVRRCRTGR